MGNLVVEEKEEEEVDAESPVRPHCSAYSLWNFSFYTACVFSQLILRNTTKLGIFFSLNKYWLSFDYVIGDRCWGQEIVSGQVYLELLTALSRWGNDDSVCDNKGSLTVFNT